MVCAECGQIQSEVQVLAEEPIIFRPTIKRSYGGYKLNRDIDKTAELRRKVGTMMVTFGLPESYEDIILDRALKTIQSSTKSSFGLNGMYSAGAAMFLTMRENKIALPIKLLISKLNFNSRQFLRVLDEATKALDMHLLSNPIDYLPQLCQLVDLELLPLSRTILEIWMYYNGVLLKAQNLAVACIFVAFEALNAKTMLTVQSSPLCERANCSIKLAKLLALEVRKLLSSKSELKVKKKKVLPFLLDMIQSIRI